MLGLQEKGQSPDCPFFVIKALIYPLNPSLLGEALVLHNFSRYNIAEKSDRRLSKMRAEEVFVSFFIIAEMTMTENS